MKSPTSAQTKVWGIIAILTMQFALVQAADDPLNGPEERGPLFAIEPPGEVTFANTKGTQVECTATGTPKPTVQWVLGDGSPTFPIQGLRELDINKGILILKPFSAEQFRPDVHAVTYKCAVNNSVGKILSTDVQVRGVVLQAYDVQVYDSFAIEGNTALFKCHIPAVLADFITVSAWIKNDNLLIKATGSASSEKYIVIPTGELHITDVAMSESNAQYKCKTTHKLSNVTVDSKSGGRLFVTAPHGNVPTKIIDIRTNVEVAVGGIAILTCVAQGYPVPNVMWYRKQSNGKISEIKSSGRYRITKSTLGILNVESADGGSYICEAVSVLGKDEAEIFVHVNEPLQLEIQPKLLTARAKESVTMFCKLSGGSAHSFTWLHNGKIIPYASGSSLSIADADAKDSGMYQCMTEVNKKRLQAAAELRLSGFPPKIVKTLNEAVLQPGGKVTLECSTTGTPLPKISWDVDGISIVANDRTQVSYHLGADGTMASSLIIQSVRVEDGGLYTCTAKSVEGLSQSSARVNVFGAIKSRIVPNQIAVAGNDVYLNCPYYGYPSNKISWMKDDRRLPYSIKQWEFPNGTLLISDIQKPSDGGKYICIVETNDGRDVQSQLELSIYVVPKIVPFSFQEELLREGMRARLQCVVSEGDLPLTITWMKDGEPLSQHAHDPTINVRVLDDFSSILTIGSINPRHNGNYTCVASNMAASVSHTAQLAVNVAPKIVPFSFQDVHFEGSAARLVCGLLEGDLPVQFLWLKNDIPIETSIDGFHTAVTVHNIEGVSSILTIKNIEAKHAGNYTCVANNRVSSAKSSAVLVVNVAPKIVPFSFQGEHLFEGAVARITCVVYQGDLPLTIEWLKDGGQLAGDADAHVRQIDEYTSILTIDHVRAEHAGNYTCMAKNHAEATSHSAVLSVNVPPKIVPFTFQDDHLIEGNLARVSCVISRGDLPLSIRWVKDGEAIPANLGLAVRSFDEHSSILTIDSVAEKHNGRYSCIASNSAGTANFSAEIIVQVPPHWILKPAENAAVISGEDVVLHCQAGGHPKPTLSWKYAKGHTRFWDDVVSDAKYHLFANGSLHIRSINSSDAGKYVCQASNGVKGGINTMVVLRIKAPPTFERSVQKAFAAVEQEFTLKCESEGDNPIVITWYKDGKMMQKSMNNKYAIASTNTTSGLSSVLTLLKTVREDQGKYECRASNDHGHNNMTFNLVIEESPEPPKDIKVSVHGSRMVELSWKQAFDGNVPISKYIIEYKTEIESWESSTSLETASGEMLTGIVANLQPATNYLFRMYAENARGRSKPSSIIKGETIEEAPASAPKNVRILTNNDNMLTVAWNAPEDQLQGKRVTGYYVGYQEEGLENAYTFKTFLMSESQNLDYSLHLTNLKKFTKYAVVVQAYNDQGKGPLSEPVVAMTSEGVPQAAPLNVRCTTLTSQNIHVAWAPPPSNVVNGILIGYKLMYRAASGWYEDEIYYSNSSTTSATIKDLEKYTNYTIQVAAATKVGEGPFSNPISCKTLDDEPGPPAEIKVLSVSQNSALLTWKHPTKPNGVIKSFTAYVRDASVRNDVTSNTLPSKLTQLEIPGLTKGKRYEFWVTASTLVGEGSNSSVVALTLNSASVSARVVPFDEKVIVPWKSDVTLSCQAVGIPLPERKWYYRDEEILNDGRIGVTSDGSLYINSVQEKDIGDYYCLVSNVLNEDRVTYTLIVLVPPSPPTVEVIHSSSNSIEIRWRMNRSGSDRVKGYILHVRREFGEWEEISLDPDVASYRLNGLECGTNYEILMAAFNSIGLGDKSPPLLVPTNGSVPAAPAKEDLIDESSTSVSISLNAWKIHSCSVLYYIVEYKLKGTGDWIFVSNNLKPEPWPLVVRDLIPGTWYRLRVTAHSSAGSTVAEYDFATVTLTGATISPDVMLQDQFLNTSSSPQVDLWVVIAVILALLLLVVGVALVSLFIKRKRAEQQIANSKDHRLSSASSGMGRDGSTSRFSYSHRNTMSRPHTGFNTMSSAGCQDDPVPYASCQLGSHNFGTLPHHGMCPPPVPDRHIDFAENLVLQNRMMLDNSGFIQPNKGPVETTFVFPNMHGAVG